MPIHRMYRTILFSGIGIFLIVGGLIGGIAIGYSHPELARKTPSVEADDPESPENQVDLKPFWRAWSLLEKKFAGNNPSAEDRLWGAISGLVASYDDPYTEFFPPKEAEIFDETIRGRFEGVGMEIGLRDGYLTVIAPFKDSPSDKAGIKAKDIIVAIDEIETDGMSLDEAVQRIRGKRGTEVILTIVRENKPTTIDIAVVRDVINIPTIKTYVEEGVFVIELYSFSPKAPGLLRGALEEFSKSRIRYLILDLRDNPGGYLDASIEATSLFLPVGKTVVREDFGDDREEVVYRSRGYNVVPSRTKIAVLVNAGSASGSEILAGALQEHDRAILVGTKTFGKGSVQQAIDLTKDTVIKITVAKWLTPDGNSISEGGLTPDIIITDEEFANALENTEEGEEPIDIVLEKAIQKLKRR
jgi:carboxyl-terminal processing protease